MNAFSKLSLLQVQVQEQQQQQIALLSSPQKGACRSLRKFRFDFHLFPLLFFGNCISILILLLQYMFQ